MQFVNQKDEFLRKILARDTSVGGSSRISYYRSGEGVPFKWEMQPGIAKEPQKEELPPLTPPPALLSLGLPKPCIQIHEPKPNSTGSRLRFWKKRAKIGKSKKLPQESLNLNEDVIGFDIFARILECSSDSDCMASPRGSSFSSSSSLLFIKTRPSLQSTGSESPTSTREVHGRPLALSCIPIPMHISRILVRIARRD